MTRLALPLAATLFMPAAAEAAFPGQNGKLALFQGDVGDVEPFGIAVADADGDNQELVGPTCQEGETDPCPGHPAWSPSGQRLAIDLEGDIATMRPDGGELNVIDLPGIDARRPAWSPDENKLVFQGKSGGSWRLYVMNRGGGGLQQLTMRGGREPAWSSDGRIAFRRKGNVFLINPDGSGLDRLTFRGGVQPNWSPKASRVAFVRDGNVHVIRVKTGKRRKLTKRGGDEPAWTPDGKRILFESGQDESRILSVRRDGTGVRLVTAGEEGRRFFASDPDQQPL